MRHLIPVAFLALSCGSNNGDPSDASEETTPDDGSETAWDVPADTTPDPDASDDIETEPPLGICGVYCMAENRPCPDGAFCEYGAIDPSLSCTDDGCGFCAWIPDDCPPEDDPSCGCDGTTYANPCERRRAHALPDYTWASCFSTDE